MSTAYWFFDLLGSDIFLFAEPFAGMVTYIIGHFFPSNISIGSFNFETSFLVFDILSFLLVYIMAKSKCGIYFLLRNLDASIYNCHLKKEIEYNEKLETEVKKNIEANNNVAVLIQLDTKDISLISYMNDKNTKDGSLYKEKAFETLYKGVKEISGCKFAKTDDKMLILLSDFDKIDNLLEFIYHAINKVRDELKKDGWLLKAYTAVDVYGNNVNFNSEIYPKLVELLNLRQTNSIVCLGTFQIRYAYKKETDFEPVRKGEYGINGESQLWTLVKKN